MRILALIHSAVGPSGTFGEAARARGHELVTRDASEGVPRGTAAEFDAFLVFGGALQVDQEESHPWLRSERLLLEEALERDAPIFGVCLGGQLLAKAAGAQVAAAVRPEIGWHEVGLTPAAADDPLFADLPERFTALQWHSYAFELPPGAVALAESPVCLQAYRLGERAWGVQFHPEVGAAGLERWRTSPEGREYEFATEPITAWEGLGRGLADRFLELAGDRVSSSPGRRS